LPYLVLNGIDNTRVVKLVKKGVIEKLSGKARAGFVARVVCEIAVNFKQPPRHKRRKKRCSGS
jgi:hypothetical protein